ncbi:uncharacterized protein LOC126796782 [Argentina anserina]|uniref:uncharacterized protein LOC126796782 n=1 Tax=Argentina anserina TaxID=57926 RepID=UPI0021762B20|nr:uncharacterized protein LOC126796782 [Potentilla anserina]
MGSQIHPLWRVRLAAALRTALACTIVGCTTLYIPKPIRSFLTYPSFSYMTTILIVSDATLGQTLMSCWHVLYATCQVMACSVMALRLIGPARFTNEVAAAAVAVSVFVVALPGSTHLMSKRIAFGQFVNVYVGTVVYGASTKIVMHPTQVAASTALGALASVLAMMIPYPRLAYYEVKKSWRLYNENASQRLSRFVDAISAEDNRVALESISQGKSLSKAAAKLLPSINQNLEGMLWERPDIKFLRPNHRDLGHRLQEMEIPIRGMEMALSSCSSFPVDMIDEGLRDHLRNSQLQVSLKLLQSKYSMPSEAATVPESKRETFDKPLWTNKTTTTTHQDLPALFFLYCMELLLGDLPIARHPGKNPNCKGKIGDSQTQPECICKRVWRSIMPTYSNFIFALKCSIALGLAVLLGLIYNKKQGYWSGLTIAISFVTGRQPTFTVANARTQGTAMGSVYGIICMFLFQRVDELRLLPLIPWIVFTHFLRDSRMYGQAGGISAAIGALLILGREHYGPPSDFAIARLAEACIGLICFTLVEVLFYPMRAATLAKNQLSQSLGALRACVQDISLSVPASTGLTEKHRTLKSHVNKLQNFIQEAKAEPNFWFLPFEGDCYNRILGSMSKMADLLPFAAHNVDFISQKSEGASQELKQHSDTDLKLLKEKIGNSLKCIEHVSSMKSLAAFDTEAQSVCDSEMGISPNPFMILGTCDDEAEATVSNFLQHLQEVVVRLRNSDDEVKDVSQMVLCLGSLGFCIRSLSEETMKIKEEVRKLIK